MGVLAPQTGPLEELGLSCLEGVNLAIREINDRGGIKDGNITYLPRSVVRDTRNSPELAVEAARELITIEKVDVLIGPPMSALASPVAKLSGVRIVPMITQIATHPDVTRDAECTFRVCFTDTFQGKVMARFAIESLKAETAAILYDTAEQYSRGIADIFRKEFSLRGGAIVREEKYITGTVSFVNHLRRIDAANPDVLFLPNYVEDLLLQMNQIRKTAITTQVIGSDTMSFRDPEDVAVIEGAYFSTHYTNDDPDPKVKSFIDLYRNEYQRTPTVAGALTYDATRLFFDIVGKVGTADSAAVCNALRNLETYTGVTGKMVFNGSPDPRKSAVILHVEDGVTRYFARVNPTD